MTTRERFVLLLAFIGVSGLLLGVWCRGGLGLSNPPSSSFVASDALRTLNQFEEQEAGKNWTSELIAQKYAAVIEEFWDAINSSSNKWTTALALKLQEIVLPRYSSPTLLPHGVVLYHPEEDGAKVQAAGWLSLLEAIVKEGWLIEQTEFRHIGFTPEERDTKPNSRFYFSTHFKNSRREIRAILEGEIEVTWEGDPGRAAILNVDARKLQMREREGPPGFKRVLEEEVEPVPGSYFIDPLIVWDLDSDGASELILAAKNRVYRRNTVGQWTQSRLCEHDIGLIFTGALGDFTGDGFVDFLTATFDGLFLYEGDSTGAFRTPPRSAWSAHPRLKYAQALALGDVEGDGDLDLFLGQYKVPYTNGQMPRPYFDANDGYPSHLLLNDGTGVFTDSTQRAGLGAKRTRRMYNASLIDLDRDGDLDLVVVSDFAGLDLYENDGKGHFADVTERLCPERYGFGMANCFADFDRDGALDLLLVGMNSPTAQRLASLRLARSYDVTDEGMRDRVTFGNRLLLGARGGAFRQNNLSEHIAHTGWSWGCAADDFDNDGFPDIYIANGHETRRSVKDYETEFWLHDIYVGDSTENSLAQLYFREKMARTRGAGWSYGGYEKNRFFLNLGGTNFVEAAYLMGIALENDSRNVVAEDVDQDGRLDLIVTTFEVYPRVRQTIQIFRNELKAEAVTQLTLHDATRSGTVVSVGENQVEALLATGSYRSQIQPRLRVKPALKNGVVERLGLRQSEFSIR